ncbi:MAG: TonB family protein [Proteobacteria bacterium]|nr:TonB family protein [Pseudomonadota bacterium]
MNTTNTRRAARGSQRRLAAGIALALALGAMLAACKQDAPTTGPAADAGTTPAAAAATPETVVSAEVSALTPEQLREAASKAYQESRLYAPGGDNAMEYYLALRDKQPADAGVSSALVDLLPMTVIATEQSRDRADFLEAKRLLALIEKTDASHPAVQRLKDSIAAAEADTARRAQQQQLTAEQETQRQQQLELERRDQQRLAQEQAARDLAAQQQAATDEAARQETARQEAARQEAARQEAARQEAARQEAARQEAARQEAARRQATPSAADLRAISTPAPRFPPEALRSGTSGEVQVEFTVGVDGSVTNARVVRADPPRVFDREAVNAVRRWRFEPVAAPVTTRRTINFAPGD